MTTRGNKSNMDSTASLSDYSEDFEEYDSSKGGNGLLKHAEVMSTPKRPSVVLPTRTIPGQRKARSHYNRPGRINNFSLGKVRAMSERPMARGTPFSPRDRELSAKLHTIKKIQNQLADCKRELADATKQNKLLTRLQVRQERDLSRVATQEGELPQILARHSEEVRMLKEQLRRSQEVSITHENKVTSLYTEVQRLKNRGKKLEQVAKQKNLLERDSLTQQLQEAKEQLHDRDRKLKELERGVEILNKTHGQEIRSLMLKKRTLSRDLEASSERTDKILDQLKERTKEMGVMNIYSQRMGRNTLNNSTRLFDVPLMEDMFSQTDLSCPPTKNVSLQTKQTNKSSSSQTQVIPSKILETRTTQTDMTPAKDNIQSPATQKPKSPVATIQHPVQMPVVTSPVHTIQHAIQSPPPSQPRAPAQDEEQQKKNILLSKLRELDSKKGPPASQPVTTISQSTITDNNHKTTEVTGTEQLLPTTHPKVPALTATQTSAQEEEAKKKKLLLAKLMAIDGGHDPKSVTLSKITTGPARANSGQSTTSVRSLQADTIDNMHKGKPAFFTEEDPFGSRKSSGSNLLVKSNSGAKASTSNNATTSIVGNQGYKPTFGRRARETKDSDKTKDIFGKSEDLTKPIFNGGGLHLNQEPFSEEEQDYPWEKRVNLNSTASKSLQNRSMVFGPMSKSPLSPLRPKAEANRVDMMPGGIAEPDDLEELIL